MAVKTTVVITHGKEAIATIKSKFVNAATIPHEQCQKFNNFFAETSAGNRACSFTTQVDSNDQVAATGSVTFSGHSTANDTFLVNGVTLTCVASGATNNQWNAGTTSLNQATSFAAAVNASTTALVSGAVSAVASGATVTFTAVLPGTTGNMCTIAKGTDAGSVMTVSGARLTGGAAPTTVYSGGTYHSGV